MGQRFLVVLKFLGVRWLLWPPMHRTLPKVRQYPAVPKFLEALLRQLLRWHLLFPMGQQFLVGHLDRLDLWGLVHHSVPLRRMVPQYLEHRLSPMDR